MFVNNCVLCIMYEIRYELNDVEIGHNRNVSIITFKNYMQMLRALKSDRYLSMSRICTRISSVTKYDKAFMGRQNGDSTWETAICYLCSADLKKYHVIRCLRVRRFVWNLSETLFKFSVLSIRWFNLDFDKKKYAVLFDMYARYRRAYYGTDCSEILFNVLSFTEKGPFVIIDCSRQNEFVKSAIVNVRIEFDYKENVLKYNSLLSHHMTAWLSIIRWQT